MHEKEEVARLIMSNAHFTKELNNHLVSLNGATSAGNAPPLRPSQDSSDRMDSEYPIVHGDQTVTPEPAVDQAVHTSQTTPSTPGLLPPFDWDDFQCRYERALAEADGRERVVLDEFEQLSRYFRNWASASATHDNGRAEKRLQTRQRYVALSEETMTQKQKHYDEVLRAFQSALALLSSK